MRERLLDGWTFQITRLTDEFNWDTYLETRSENAMIMFWIKPSGAIAFASVSGSKPSANDRIMSFALPREEARAEAVRSSNAASDIAEAVNAADSVEPDASASDQDSNK